MSKIDTFIKSLEKGEILIPKLKAFLEKENDLIQSGKRSRKEGVIKDAELSVRCFKKRIAEFNHGEDLEGEFFHPSAMGACQRKMFYEIYKAPTDSKKTTGDELLRSHFTFETGTYMHVFIQNLCSRAGLLIKREVAIQNAQLRVIGHGDGILRIDGHKYLLEIKTINSTGFSRLDGPKHEHKAQATAYMKALGLRHALFLYWDKDRGTLKEYNVDYSEKFWREHCVTRIDSFFKAIKTKIVPEREGPQPNAYPCLFCNFKRVCWDTAVGKVFESRLPKTKVPEVIK